MGFEVSVPATLDFSPRICSRSALRKYLPSRCGCQQRSGIEVLGVHVPFFFFGSFPRSQKAAPILSGDFLGLEHVNNVGSWRESKRGTSHYSFWGFLGFMLHVHAGDAETNTLLWMSNDSMIHAAVVAVEYQH